MDVSFTLCSIFLNLLLLSMIHGNLGREIPKEAEQKVDDHLCLNGHDCQMDMHAHPSSSSSSSSSHMDHIHIKLAWNILFHIEELKLGQKIPLYFPIKSSSQSAHLIPKEEADSIPFSSTQLPQILDFFNFPLDSPQAKAMTETLMHCELPPLQGESKFCATSLESMLDKLGQLFGKAKNFRVLTTTQIKNWTPHLQNYTIVDDPKEIKISKMFGCHPMPYPYAVFYCHGQESDNRLFMLSLEGEDGLRVEAVSICHMDTSHWDPEHASFRMLGVEPGMPVCHVFPQDNLVWVSSPDSVN